MRALRKRGVNRRLSSRCTAARWLSRLGAAMLAAAMLAGTALAGEVRVPLTVDYLALREALKHEIYTAPGGRAPLWDGADECQFLYAENPGFSHAATGVTLDTAANLGVGVKLGERCVSPIAWDGIAAADGSPYVAPGLKLKFHFTDLNLYNPQHKKTLLVSRGFDLVKRYLIPRLEAFEYDLNPAVQQLGRLAEDASTPEVGARLRAAFATVRAEPEVGAGDDGIRITIVMTVPDFATPTPAPGASPTPAAPTAAELAAFEKQLDDWDAFLVFAIKELGGTVGDQQFRDELLAILLDSRHRLVQALQNPAANAGPDPVRILFLDEWRQLRDAVKSAAARGMLGARALEFLSFISAGDALFALDQAAPALGMRISANDLRRLAHIMAPKATGDPLQFNFDEDASLKELFGIPEPPESPGPLDKSEEIAPTPTPTASPSAKANSPAPAATPTPAKTSKWSRWLAVFQPREAAAAETDLLPRLREVARRLHRVVVNESNADRYRDDMARLLDLSAERELALDGGGFDPRARHTYALLVKSAAWQESCWRQFVRAGRRIRWLESSTGDIGLMQVNKHVWRGFYKLERLEWDVLYNAGAGTEILMRMTRHAIAHRGRAGAALDADSIARGAYAAYNGGPVAHDRWRKREPPELRQIDDAFWEKYRAVKQGAPIDILSCAATWGHAPGH